MNQEFDLELALRRALTREEPSRHFAARVLARRAGRQRQAATRVWMAIAAMLLVGIFIISGVRRHEMQREMAAQKAGRDLVLALKITSAKLQATHRMIRRRSDGV